MHNKPDEHPPLQLERLPPVGPPSCARSREGTKNNRKMMQTDDAILSNDGDVNRASILTLYNQLRFIIRTNGRRGSRIRMH